MSEASSFRELIETKVKPDFLKMAPPSMKLEAEADYAMQILTNNEFLMKVARSNPVSLVSAMKNVAAIGLSLNPAKKQAYLIPRSVKIGNDFVSKVFLEPSYMGLCDVATQSGDIEWVQARCVYSNDEFTDNGIGEKPTHRYNAFGKDRGEFVGVYCVAKTKEGDYLTTLMDADQINSIKERSESWKAFKAGKAKSGGPWQSDFEEMAKKSVVRNAFKTWPKTGNMERLEQAVHLSNENEGFDPITTAPELNEFTAEQKKHFDHLITKSDAMGMAVFMSSMDHGVQTALYNSFEKGTITKYKNIVSKLEMDGRKQIEDIKQVIIDAAQTGDDLAVKELLPDLSQEVTDWLMEKFDNETRGFVMLCQQEAA